jgi:hypothetical protein
MASDTLDRMARKKKPDAAGQQAPAGTAVVRIDADLARMANIIATVTGEDMSAVLSPLLRPQLEARYAKVVRQLHENLEGE